MLSLGLNAGVEQYFAHPTDGWYLSGKVSLGSLDLQSDYIYKEGADARNRRGAHKTKEKIFASTLNADLFYLKLDLIGKYNHPSHPGIICNLIISGKIGVSTTSLAKDYLNRLVQQAEKKLATQIADRKIAEALQQRGSKGIRAIREFRQSQLIQKAEVLRNITLDTTRQAKNELLSYQNYNRQILQKLQQLKQQNTREAKILEYLLHSNQAELRQLNQVGAKRAQSILALVEQGGLQNLDDIQKVKGLKGKNLQKLLQSKTIDQILQKNQNSVALLENTYQSVTKEIVDLDDVYQLLNKEETLRAFEDEVLEEAAKALKNKNSLVNQAKTALEAAKSRLDDVASHVKTTVYEQIFKTLTRVGVKPQMLQRIGRFALKAIPFVNIPFILWDIYEVVKIIVQNQTYVGAAGDNPFAAFSEVSIDPRVQGLDSDTQKQFIQQLLSGQDGVALDDAQFDQLITLTQEISPDEAQKILSFLEDTQSPDVDRLLAFIAQNLEFLQSGKNPGQEEQSTENTNTTQTPKTDIKGTDIGEPMVELEVESNVGEGEFVVDMPEREDKRIFVERTRSPRNTTSFKGIKGRFFINSPSVKEGDSALIRFVGTFNNKPLTIQRIKASVITINPNEIKLHCLFDYSFELQGKKIFLRKDKIITVIKRHNGKKIMYTF